MGLLASLYAGLFGRRRVSDAIYDFTVMDIHGEEIDFAQFKGKKLLIVNTASKCGYTGQYADLEKLHREYANSLTVLGFPSNNFLWQEPGTDQNILAFCTTNYDVTFKMFSKISVKGRSKHPLYQWLQSKTGKSPSWNFCKYLVSEDGTTVKYFGSKVNPLDPQIVNEIAKVKS
jgi:glutathione peroxidase